MVQTEHVLGSYEPDLVAYINSIPRPARLLLVDPVGAGRAYSVAAAIRALFYGSQDAFRCLIVVPDSRVLLEHWSDLLRGFGLDVILANPPFAGRQRFSEGGVTVASAQIIPAYPDVLWNIDWDLVVVDDPQLSLSEEWLQQGAMQFWEGASNVSVAIALSPVIPEEHWFAAHPKTRVVRRQHGALPDDLPRQTFWIPSATEQPKLMPAIQVIRDYFDIPGETSKFAETRNVSFFIADIISSSPQQWIDKEAAEPLYSQMVRFLLAVGQVVAATYPEPPVGKDENSIRLPSEEFLAEQFGVHRVTARRAFEELRNRGLLRRNQGGSHLILGNITGGEPAVSPGDAGVSFDETAIEEVRALYEADGVPFSIAPVLQKLRPELTGTPLDPERILEEVSVYYNIIPEDNLRRPRTRKIYQARQVAMYLLFNELEMSFTQVGRFLGVQNHAVALDVEEVNADGRLQQEVLRIKEAIFTTAILEPAKSSTEQPAVEEFRTIMNKYGLEAKSAYFQQAIRLSFVSGGGGGVELPDQDGQVLRQLGVGWPGLSEYGLRIGRELTNSLIESKADTIEEILAFVPPRVVALFIQEARPTSRGSEDLYSLRIPEEKRHGAVLSPLSSAFGLLTHNTVRSLAVGLGNRLVELELATTRMGPAYRGAKWNATFFEFPGVVGQSIKRWMDDKETSLEPVERLLKQLELLRKFPIPSFQEFDSNGIGWEALVALLGTAMSRGIISEVVDQGPAFLILDQTLYDQLVVTPVFNKLVDDILLDKLSSMV